MAQKAIGSCALAAASALAIAVLASDAAACGGFFCGRQPVDQTAERILFEVGQGSVTMTTQISFNGKAEDFAWVLPLSAVPAENSLSVFQQQALNALDANSGPVFNPPADPACYGMRGAYAPGTAVADSESTPGAVTVYIRQEVGEYDVAVIESDDPQALIEWLLAEGYRITPPMHPYIERYTSEGLKFLALKLLDSADVKDLKPFRFTLPGTSPSIPLRMTALAAEPEMSILAFVLADERYEGKNWPNLEIPDDQIRYNPFGYSYPAPSNWSKLVAQAVDTAGGQGWVTEYAGPSASYAEQVRAQVAGGNFATEDDRTAAVELLGALEAHPYLTRLYTRLSAEEMTSDPLFGRSALGDVKREHQLYRRVNGIDQCSEDLRTSIDPCDFATCGAAGLCRPVAAREVRASAAPEDEIAGCACLPGATARTSFGPDGSATVICQDGRMSFLNAGDRESETAPALPDACAGFDCGEHGQCIAMNMTPTCVCDQGFVAIGTLADDGTRGTRCVEPPELVPAVFYQTRLRSLPEQLPGGRAVPITEPLPMPMPGEGNPEPVSAGFPMPRANPALSDSSGGCSMAGQTRSGPAWLLALIGAGTALRLRGRRPRGTHVAHGRSSG
jgi:hypothetical protein